jgi:hypothetical protein
VELIILLAYTDAPANGDAAAPAWLASASMVTISFERGPSFDTFSTSLDACFDRDEFSSRFELELVSPFCSEDTGLKRRKPAR